MSWCVTSSTFFCYSASVCSVWRHLLRLSIPRVKQTWWPECFGSQFLYSNLIMNMNSLWLFICSTRLVPHCIVWREAKANVLTWLVTEVVIEVFVTWFSLLLNARHHFFCRSSSQGFCVLHEIERWTYKGPNFHNTCAICVVHAFFLNCCFMNF